MNQKSKNRDNNKKFVCIFDSSHFVESEEKLVVHMKKCKAMEKQSYECCKYNPLHWVKYDVISSHEEACPDKNKPAPQSKDFTKILPQEISRIQFSIPFDIDMSMVQSSNMMQKKKKTQKIEQPSKNTTEAMKKTDKGFYQKPRKIEMWKEPCFEDFVKKRGYKEKNHIRTAHQNDSFIGGNQSFLI